MTTPFASRRDAYRLLAMAVTRSLCLVEGLPPRNGGALRALAGLTDALQPQRRRQAARALEAAFPGRLTAADKRAIVREGYRHLWFDVCAQCAREGSQPLLNVEVRGLERLREARAAGRGVIVWESSAFGFRALGKRLLAERGMTMVQLHGPNHFGAEATHLGRRVIGPYFDACERRFVREILRVPGDDSLAFARALGGRLAEGAALCSAGDGTMGRRFLRLPFLGQAQRFATGLASLARLHGVAILPFFCWERSEGACVVEIGEPIAAARGEDRDGFAERAVGTYAGLLQAHARAYPGQYRNWYRLEPSDSPLRSARSGGYGSAAYSAERST